MFNFSFPDCYAAAFSPLQVGNENLEDGVPLEHLITCVPSITVVTAQNGFKVIKWVHNKPPGQNSGRNRHKYSSYVSTLHISHMHLNFNILLFFFVCLFLQSPGFSVAKVRLAIPSSSSLAERLLTCWRVSHLASCRSANSYLHTTITLLSNAESLTTVSPSCWSFWKPSHMSYRFSKENPFH